MAIDNIYNSISKYSVTSILNQHIFDIEPEVIQLDNSKYLIYPLGLKDGVIFYNYLCDNILNNIWVEYFSNPTGNLSQLPMYKINFLSSLFRIISDVYNISGDIPLYNILQRSSFKQIKYLIYIIKKQNFTQVELNKFSEHSYSNTIDYVERVNKILNEYKETLSTKSAKNKLLEIDAIEYNTISSSDLKIDYTVQFFKDYILGNDNFYIILSNGFMNKFVNIAANSSYFLNNENPTYWCKIINLPCTQGCKFFDIDCKTRYIKKNSYFPFKSIYAIPQILALNKSINKESELDVLVRSFLYSIQSAFGRGDNLKGFYTFNHNDSIKSLIDKNKLSLFQSLFNNNSFDDIETKLRDSMGLTERNEDSFENINEILFKMYSFIKSNKETFLSSDQTRLDIFTEFVDIQLNNLLCNHQYISDDVSIGGFTDFSDYVTKLSSSIIYINNMLMKFPNDMNAMDTMINNMLKYIKTSKSDMKKLTGSQAFIDPRETLLTSDAVLFKRIAVDDGLYKFYRENNRTRLVNNVLFWKQTIAYSFFAEMVLKLPENHAIQTMDFNDL